MDGTSPFRDDVLAGRVAFVTGGGSGICKGIARALMMHGAETILVGRNAERLVLSAAELARETGRKCTAAPADVRDPKAVEAAIDRGLGEHGHIDTIVNGAAGNFLAPAAQLSYNGFRAVMDIDALGTFHVCKAGFEKALRDRGGGVILNISATLHYGATPMQVHASAAKAAVDSITRSLALEWGPFGVRVVGIAPGPIDDTEGAARLVPPGTKRRMEAAIPIKRFGRIDEIAHLAVYLCTGAASLVHGVTIIADGGAYLGGSLHRALLEGDA